MWVLKMTDNSEVWRVIRDARDDRGWTNQRLAEESGVPESSVQKIITGKILNPSFDSIIAICRALDLSVDKLCGIDSNAAVDEIAQLRAALALAEERRKTAEAKREVAETKLEAQIHEYNQMVEAYEYRIHISKDRVIWLRKFLIFTCALIVLFILAFMVFLFIDVTNRDVGWIRSMSLYIGGNPHAKCCNICSFFLI